MTVSQSGQDEMIAVRAVQCMIVFTVCLLMLGTTCHCAPILIDDIADMVLLTGSQDFSENALQSNTQIYVFQERSNYVLPSDVTVDATSPGTYSSDPGTATITAGTSVNAYIVHMDVTQQTTHGSIGGNPSAGGITFDYPIIGVIGMAANLDATDSVLGDPDSTYSPVPDSRGFWETNDK